MQGKEQQQKEQQQEEEQDSAIKVSNLTKAYRRGGNSNIFYAVNGVSFSVRRGEIFGLLGPNGAGKTTTIKMIVTLAKATSGRLEVFGTDVAKSPQTVRGMLGYVPQSISVDADLTAYENLLIFSKLSYVSDKQERDERIRDALKYMDLVDRENDLVKHFSGGMMRRLEIAQALVNRPKILLLDEPSIGLDPASKRQVWKNIKQLRHDYGTTILITTHDMAEADILCDRVAIMSAGKIAVMGNPAELKRTVGGGDRVNVNLAPPVPRQEDLKKFLAGLGTVVVDDDYVAEGGDGNGGHGPSKVQILVNDGGEAIPHITDSLRSNGIRIESISVSKPTLDDVFMKYAKRRLVAPSAVTDENNGDNDQDGTIFAGNSHSRSTRRDFARHSK
ncbi:MAG TPA: ATP-binding cassette domain-containing protein [Nitrososphaera sp.]|nr:ATP-binding cassette domain-containing protein [Nitrososphaera sp.]